MVPFDPSMYPHTITIRRKTDRTGTAGYESPGVSLRASVQQIGPTRREYTPIGGVVSITHFAVRTAESTEAHVDDLIEWMGHRLFSLGPPRPVGADFDSNPVSWLTDAEERSG